MSVYESREPRTAIALYADISDGKHTYKGVVVNVSKEGLKVIELLQKFDFYSEIGDYFYVLIKDFRGQTMVRYSNP